MDNHFKFPPAVKPTTSYITSRNRNNTFKQSFNGSISPRTFKSNVSKYIGDNPPISNEPYTVKAGFFGMLLKAKLLRKKSKSTSFELTVL